MRARRVHVILRNDDPGALSDAEYEARWMSLFARHGVPHVAAVVPHVVDDPHDERCERYHLLHENAAMVDLLRRQHAAGMLEIAQHGYTHRTNLTRPSAASARGGGPPFKGIAGPWLPMQPAHADGYSEFAGLPYPEQHDRIVRGKAYLEDLLSLELRTFIFPWNTADAASLRAVRKAGFNCVLGGEGAGDARACRSSRPASGGICARISSARSCTMR